MAWYPMLLHRTVLPLRDGAKHLRILGAGIGGIIWTAYLLFVCETQFERDRVFFLVLIK